jgi:hypothetical protein
MPFYEMEEKIPVGKERCLSMRRKRKYLSGKKERMLIYEAEQGKPCLSGKMELENTHVLDEK